MTKPNVGKKENGRTEELRLAPFNSRRIRRLTSPAESGLKRLAKLLT
jgi:hypothetical protein